MNTNEEWKDVKGFTNYEVSDLGRVRNKHNKRLKAIRCTKTGYCITDLKENNKKSTKYIHRLVSEAFIPNPNDLPCINHKDENKSNNNVNNLEWCDVKYNNSYGSHINKIKRTQQLKSGKKYVQIDVKTNEVINIYNSLKDCAKSVGVKHQAIIWALSKPSHTCKGYRWEVVE